MQSYCLFFHVRHIIGTEGDWGVNVEKSQNAFSSHRHCLQLLLLLPRNVIWLLIFPHSGLHFHNFCLWKQDFFSVHFLAEWVYCKFILMNFIIDVKLNKEKMGLSIIWFFFACVLSVFIKSMSKGRL